MGVNFPDLQVLLPRVTEMGRLPTAGQQVDAQQQSLAMAAQVEAERDRRRVTRTGDTARGTAPRQAAVRRDRSDGGSPVHDKLGRHLDVRG
ncbi:MAG TPA: hypothetical protein VKZ69_01690 [Limnochordales bacterium]|nr:hypothetical protein [Limnochordales bacterium]